MPEPTISDVIAAIRSVADRIGPPPSDLERRVAVLEDEMRRVDGLFERYATREVEA